MRTSGAAGIVGLPKAEILIEARLTTAIAIANCIIGFPWIVA
jgi:hypothetical protein